MWGLCSSPPTPPPSPHAIKLFKCLCFSVRLWVLCVCLLRACVFMFLTVCCRHLEPSKKRNIAEVCFGKSKRKLTAEGGGKLKCCFFPLSSLASLSFSNYAAGSVPATRKSRGNPFAMQIVTKKAVALTPSGSRSSG